MPVLELHQVVKEYVDDSQPVRALDGVSLEIQHGQFIAVIGRSGCGKSTLLNVAGAMDFPTSGQVVLDGVCTSHLTDAALTSLRREKAGFIFQSFQLLHTLTALENVELPLLLAGKKNSRGTALDRLRWVELDHLASRFPHQLSGGQMQRVAIARALVASPALILADEPTGNLDTVTASHILDLLRQLSRERGTTVLMATHSPESVGLAQRVIRMRDGRIEPS